MRPTLVAIALVIGAFGQQGTNQWHFRKDDPKTSQRSLTIDAEAFRALPNASAIELIGVDVKFFSAQGKLDSEIHASRALLDKSNSRLQYGPNFAQVINLSSWPNR